MTHRTDALNRSTNHTAAVRNFARFLVACTLGLAAAGCGQRADAPDPALPATGLPGAARGLPALAALDSLPLPQREKAASWGEAPNNLLFGGQDYILASPGVAAEASWVTMPARNASPEYVVYAIDGLSAAQPAAGWRLRLGDQGNWAGRQCIALANYATGRWEFRPVNAGTCYLLGATPADYVSPGGRAYAAVIAAEGKMRIWDMTVHGGHVTVASDSALPAPTFDASPLPSGADLYIHDYYDLRASHFELAISGPDGERVVELPLSCRGSYANRGGTFQRITGLAGEAEHTLSLRAVLHTGEPSAAEVRSCTPDAGWIRSWSPGKNVQINGLAVLPDASIMAAGSLSDDSGAASTGGLLLHFSPEGELLAALAYPGTIFQQFRATADGFTAAGLAKPPLGPSQRFVARLDSAGAPLWAKMVPADEWTPGWDAGLAADTTGGSFHAWTDANVTNNGQARQCLLRLTADGALDWARTVAGSGERYALTTLELSEGGDLLAAGLADTSAGISRSCRVLRFSPAGELRWARGLPTGESGGLSELARDDADGCYVSGQRNGCLLLRLDAAGNMAWGRSFDGLSLPGYGMRALTSDGAGGVWVAADNPGYNRWMVSRWSPDGAMLSARTYEYDYNASTEPALLGYSGGQLILGGHTAGGLGRGWETPWGSHSVDSEAITDTLTSHTPELEQLELDLRPFTLRAITVEGMLDLPAAEAETSQAFMLRFPEEPR